MYVREGASAKEVADQYRRWERMRFRAMILLIPLRLTLAVGTFALSVRPNGIRKAAKEAWKLWNLQIH